MNHNTNEKPAGREGPRLALAFGRARSEHDDISPDWLGAQCLDEQRRSMEHAAKERGLEILWFAVGYENGEQGQMSIASALIMVARERGIRTLLVPTRRYLASFESDEPPYYWERAVTEARIEIVETALED